MPPDSERLWRNMGKRRSRKTALSKGQQALNKEISRAHELRTAEAIRGFPQPGSGAFKGLKGDAISEEFLVECKATRKQQMAIKAAWLVKLDTEATLAGKLPAVAIQFGSMPPSVPRNWVMVPEPVLARLVEIWRSSGNDA